MRLIDADEIMPMMQKKLDMQDTYLPIHFQELVVDEMPTIKTTPVVLCAHCKYYEERIIFGRETGFCTRGEKFSPNNVKYTPEYGFCNFGERSEE